MVRKSALTSEEIGNIWSCKDFLLSYCEIGKKKVETTVCVVSHFLKNESQL